MVNSTDGTFICAAPQQAVALSSRTAVHRLKDRLSCSCLKAQILAPSDSGIQAAGANLAAIPQNTICITVK